MEPQWKHVQAAGAAALLGMAFALCLALSGCPKPIPPPVPPTDWDGGAATCETACARLQQLGCPSGKPTPKGAPCVEVCEHVQASGLIEWDLSCVARAVSCGETDLCAR